jgi:nitrate reductase delta subunit
MTRELFQSFSSLLSYPDSEIAESAWKAASAATFAPQAAGALAAFADLALEVGSDKMRELYTAAFDLQPLCAPYVAYQLCGEDARRGRFLMKLRELYRRNGNDPGLELADHLSQVLSFVATAPDSPERSALVEDGLKPAVEKMAGAFVEGENPYGRLIEALRTCLETAPSATAGRTCKEVAHA